jgi:hypothetical protein
METPAQPRTFSEPASLIRRLAFSTSASRPSWAARTWRRKAASRRSTSSQTRILTLQIPGRASRANRKLAGGADGARFLAINPLRTRNPGRPQGLEISGSIWTVGYAQKWSATIQAPLRSSQADRFPEPRCGSRCVLGESAAREFRHGQNRSFIQGAGGDFHAVPDVLAVRKRDLAGVCGGHEDILAPKGKKRRK